MRDFHAIPGGQAYTPILTDRAKPQSWFTIYNEDYPLLVGYVFPSDDHPWIIDWQNQPRADAATGTARGIEFGTSPFDEGLRKSVERAQMLGAPTYEFIGARQRLSTTFTIFLQRDSSGVLGRPGCATGRWEGDGRAAGQATLTSDSGYLRFREGWSRS